MQDSLCGTKALMSTIRTDQHGKGFAPGAEVDVGVMEQVPGTSTSVLDPAWLELIDELIDPPLDDMLSSPMQGSVPSRASLESTTTADFTDSYALQQKAGVAATPGVVNFQEQEDGDQYEDEDPFALNQSGSDVWDLEFVTDNSCPSPLTTLHKVASAPHLNQFHEYGRSVPVPVPACSTNRTGVLSKTRSFCSSPTSAVHHRGPPSSAASPLREHQQPKLQHGQKQKQSQQAPGESQESSHRKMVHSASSASLNSPLQSLLDQDPSALLGTSQKPLVEYKPQVSGIQLIHMLLSCAEKIALEEINHARSLVMQLQQLAFPKGDSIHRVATYFADALTARLTGTGSRSYMALRAYDPISLEEILGAYHILYQICPYIKFAHFTSNQAIFEAFEGEDSVHIIDLEILQGYQWPAFMQALAARNGGPPHLRITGVGMPLEAVQETGKRLSDLADSLHVPFQYHAVGERLEDLEAHMLHRRFDEALAVNSIDRLHRLISEEPLSPLVRLLNMIRDQMPKIVTLVEQEASHNTNSFLSRFLEAMHYYSAIFDSLEATLPQSSPERAKVEQVVFSSEITNIIACEGAERIVRHEKVDKWCKIMESIGFQNVQLSPNAVHQSQLLLRLYPTDGYTLVEEKGCLLLGWQDRAIIGASAWKC